MDYDYKMFVRNAKLTFSIYSNTNVMQELVNIGKPCVLFLNKTKHIMKCTSKPLCARGSLMTQFTNLDIEKNLTTYNKKHITTSNKMLVIHK